MLVDDQIVSLAFGRFLHRYSMGWSQKEVNDFWRFIGLKIAASYTVTGWFDATKKHYGWEIPSEDAANNLYQLAGPNYQTVFKIMEIKHEALSTDLHDGEPSYRARAASLQQKPM